MHSAIGLRGADGTYGVGGATARLLMLASHASKAAAAVIVAAAVLLCAYTVYAKRPDAKKDGDVSTYLRQAGVFAQSEDYAKAQEMYQKCLALDPANADAFFGLFYAARAAGLRDDALLYARMAVGAKGIGGDERYGRFVEDIRELGDADLLAEAYAKWLNEDARGMEKLTEAAKACIATHDWDGAIAAAWALAKAGGYAASGNVAEGDVAEGDVAGGDVADGIDGNVAGSADSYVAGGAGGTGSTARVAIAVLAQAADAAKAAAAAPDKRIAVCEAWLSLDGSDPYAAVALADAYADAGMVGAAADAYRDALDADARCAAAYDGLLRLLYKNEQIKERYETLGAAVRNVGSQKYDDMLVVTRAKLSEQYSTVTYDGVVYKDGITRVAWVDADDVELTGGTASDAEKDSLRCRIYYYDEEGNEKTLTLDRAGTDMRLADIDRDGVREALVTRRIAESVDGISADAAQSVEWIDVFCLDRSVNRLVYATPEYPAYYVDVFAPSLQKKIRQFESLQEAMEGHYGVTYGLIRAMRQAALDFAAGEWSPDYSGDALRARMSEALVANSLEEYATFKGTPFGQMPNDLGTGAIASATDGNAAGAVLLGMSEPDARALLGAPRHTTEEQFEGQDPNGSVRPYLNKILEYPDMNVHTSDGVVKAFRVNTRNVAGPRFLRVGDTVADIVNKFPASCFDGVAGFIERRSDGEIEFVDAETGAVLAYTAKDGVIVGIAVFENDGSGDWRPGENIETVRAADPAPPAGSEASGGADSPTAPSDSSDSNSSSGSSDSNSSSSSSDSNGSSGSSDSNGASGSNDSNGSSSSSDSNGSSGSSSSSEPASASEPNEPNVPIGEPSAPGGLASAREPSVSGDSGGEPSIPGEPASASEPSDSSDSGDSGDSADSADSANSGDSGNSRVELPAVG